MLEHAPQLLGRGVDRGCKVVRRESVAGSDLSADPCAVRPDPRVSAADLSTRIDEPETHRTVLTQTLSGHVEDTVHNTSVQASSPTDPTTQDHGWQMCEGATLEVGDGLFDDCVGAVGLLSFQHDQWGVGELSLPQNRGDMRYEE